MGQRLARLIRNEKGRLCVCGREDSPIPQEGLKAVGDPFSVKDPFKVGDVFDVIGRATSIPDISSANAYRPGRIHNGQIPVQLYRIPEEFLHTRGCGHESDYG